MVVVEVQQQAFEQFQAGLRQEVKQVAGDEIHEIAQVPRLGGTALLSDYASTREYFPMLVGGGLRVQPPKSCVA